MQQRGFQPNVATFAAASLHVGQLFSEIQQRGFQPRDEQLQAWSFGKKVFQNAVHEMGFKGDQQTSMHC